ncbi:MAG: TraX family protein [Rickettsiales bacterium]|nr:TraX family protein [Rickettsiales bacterium]
MKDFFANIIEFSSPSTQNRVCNNYDVLKFIAIFTMVIDHIGSYFFQDIEIFREIGRIAFPIFLFLVGYSEKFEPRYNLLFYGIIITIAHNSLIKFQQADILISIFLSCLVMKYLKNKNYLDIKYFNEILISTIIWSFFTSFIFAYGTIAFMFAIAGYFFKTQPENNKVKLFLFISIFFNLLNYYVFSSTPKTSLNTIFIVLIGYITYFLLSNFRLSEVNFIGKDLIKSVSQNALFIYIFHKLLFILMAYYAR